MAEEQVRINTDPNFIQIPQHQLQGLAAFYERLIQASRDWKGVLMEVTGEFGLNPHQVQVDFQRGGFIVTAQSPAPDPDGQKTGIVRSLARARKRRNK